MMAGNDSIPLKPHNGVFRFSAYDGQAYAIKNVDDPRQGGVRGVFGITSRRNVLKNVVVYSDELAA